MTSLPPALSRAAAFAAVALGIHLVLAGAYVHTAGPAHVAVQLDEAFLSSKQPLDLLVVGDSHGRNAIDGEALPNALNIAVGGEHYVKSYYRLRWLLAQRHRKVRAVALSFDVTSFSPFKTDHYAPEWVWGRYVDFWELGMRKRQPGGYAGRALKAKLVPYAGEIETVFEYASGVGAFRDQRSAARFGDLPPQAQEVLAKETVDRHYADGPPVDPAKRWAFLSLLRMLKASGIRVVLVSHPLTRQYSEAARALGAHAAMEDQVLAELELVSTSTVGDDAKAEASDVLEHEPVDGEILHLSYETLLHDGDNALFLDADHLNARGQAAFTDLVRAQLRRRRFWHKRKAAADDGG